MRLGRLWVTSLVLCKCGQRLLFHLQSKGFTIQFMGRAEREQLPQTLPSSWSLLQSEGHLETIEWCAVLWIAETLPCLKLR